MLSRENISALATPAGGAIAIIRLSGPDVISIVNGVFSKDITNAKGNTLHYGTISDESGAVIDDVIVSVYRAPHSYTGEDCVEISCHGSRYIIQNLLMLLQRNGTRQADHGEYTMRAYLNGKMDLSQAEAVADLIAAGNKASHDVAVSQLKGHFSSELAQLREKLLKLTSLLELELDFSDHEDLEFADRSELRSLAETIDKKIVSLAHSFETGQAIKNGIPVAIIGKTNVGKSTLLNQLLQEDKAIVSDIDGTTRDTIDGTLDIHGVTFRFIDTAGIRHTEDKVEKIGIERAYEQMAKASIILWLIDKVPSEAEIAEIRSHLSQLEPSSDSFTKSLLIVFNKSDLLSEDKIEDLKKEITKIKVQNSNSDADDSSSNVESSNSKLQASEFGVEFISAKSGSGIKSLKEKIYSVANIPEINDDTVIVTNTRHYEALTSAHADLTRVLNGMAAGLSGDLLAEDLRLCLSNLADITGGQITPQETLNNIFSHFCIGK